MSNKREFRTIAQPVTATGNKVVGYFAKFNTLSENLGGFVETIAPGAFTRSLSTNPDVCAFVDHDSSKIIGRTTAKTLTVSEDNIGLAFSLELPDTTYARDLKVSMDRGDIGACSFGFFTNEDSWEERGGLMVRTLKEVTVFEGSIVSLPAYKDTSAQLRTMFPDGQIELPTAKTTEKRDNEDCTCDCIECLEGDCADCMDSDCSCEGCTCNQRSLYITSSEKYRLELRIALAKRFAAYSCRLRPQSQGSQRSDIPTVPKLLGRTLAKLAEVK